MAARDYKGAAVRALLGADITSGSTSITLNASPGAGGWPDGSGGEFYVTIDRDTGSGTHTEESILVLSRSGLTLTLASSGKRGQNDTTAASHLAGVYVEHTASKADFAEANAFVNNPALVGAITTSVQGDTAAAGVAGTWARGDHKHAREALPAVFALASNSNVSIPNTTPTRITWDTEISDTANGHSTVSNTGRYTIPTAGLWQFNTSINWAANATGYRQVFLYKNGSSTLQLAAMPGVAAIDLVQSGSAILSCAAADYIEVFVAQTSGGALNVQAAANDPAFSGFFLR